MGFLFSNKKNQIISTQIAKDKNYNFNIKYMQ
jgi:hypothetical protein